MKKKTLLIAILTVFMLAFSLSAVGCDAGELWVKAQEGPETGTYYFDAEDAEYFITFHDVDKVNFNVMGDELTGSYTVENDIVTMVLNKKIYRMTLIDNNEFTLTYKDVKMTFLAYVDYAVTFEVYGGTEVEAQTVTNGKTVTEPELPERGEKDIFLGWYKDEEFTELYDFAEAVTEDITLYAYWRPLNEYEFTVSFNNTSNPYSEEYFEPVTTQFGKLAAVPTPEEVEGYTFNGWWVCLFNVPEMYAYKYTPDTVFTQNTTLYAAWEATEETTKLDAPEISYDGKTVSWNEVEGAQSYYVYIEYAIDGNSEPYRYSEGLTTTEYSVNLNEVGLYKIEVGAIAENEDDSSSSEIYYACNVLDNVSIYEVEGTVIKFNPVANAEYYTLYITTNENGTAEEEIETNEFDFAEYIPESGTIWFLAVPHAENYISFQLGGGFEYSNYLDYVRVMAFNEGEGLIIWNEVENAEKYVLFITSNGETEYFETEGTTYDVKSYPAGEITIEIYPVAYGYVSPITNTYTFEKKSLATPEDITIAGTLFSWNEVEGANHYQVKIGESEFTAENSTLDLADYAWETGEYTFEVMAVDENGETSAWSNPFKFAYGAITELYYEYGEVKWNAVVGAEKMQISVGGGIYQYVDQPMTSYDFDINEIEEPTFAIRLLVNGKFTAWKELQIHVCEITFTDYESEESVIVKVANGDMINVPYLENEGMIFLGWYNDEGESLEELYPGYVYFGDNLYLEFYADWGYDTVEEFYEITLDYGEYAYGEYETTMTVSNYDFYNLPVPTSNNNDFAFAGWFDAEGMQVADEYGNFYAEVLEDVTFYAQWTEKLVYELNEDNNGYKVSVANNIDTSFVTEITIPATYNNLPVVKIESGAFTFLTNLTKVTFEGSNGVALDVEEGAFVFDYNLTEINIGNGRVNVNPLAFMFCAGVENINVAQANPSYTSRNGVLYNKTGNKIVMYPAAKNTETYTIAGVKEIGDYAFFGNAKIKTLIIPASSQYDIKIGAGAFAYSAIETLTFTGNDGDANILVGDYAFADCVNLYKLTVCANVSEIGDYAFAVCISLYEMNADELPENIGKDAFANTVFGITEAEEDI